LKLDPLSGHEEPYGCPIQGIFSRCGDIQRVSKCQSRLLTKDVPNKIRYNRQNSIVSLYIVELLIIRRYLEKEVQPQVSDVDTKADIDAVDAVPVLPPPVSMKVEEKQSKKDSTESRLSSLDLENKLLKNEVQSLNEELATFSSRLKEQQEGLIELCCLCV